MIPLIYDLVLLVILVVCIASGFRKGVLRTVLSVICFILAFAAASFMSSSAVTEQIYENHLQKRVNSIIEEAVDKAKAQAIQKLKDYASSESKRIASEEFGLSDDEAGMIGDIAESIISGADDYIKSENSIFSEFDLTSLLTNSEINDRIKKIVYDYSDDVTDAINVRLPVGVRVSRESVEGVICTDDAVNALIYETIGQYTASDGETVSAYLERSVVRPLVLKALRVIIFAASFFIASLLCRIASQVLLAIRNIETIKTADSFLGAVFGAIQGIFFVLAAVCAAYVVITLTGGLSWLNEDIVSQTAVFGRLYGILAQTFFELAV